MCVAPRWDPVNNVPRACGTCSECLEKKPKDWAVRGFLHHSMRPELPAYFITFTYDEEHNPGIVYKAIAQALKKRFAYHVGYGYKSIMCGEYGELYGRPHYHMCVWLDEHANFDYNCGNNDIDAYNPPDDIWPYGKIDVRPLTPERVAYTCGYEVKNGKVKARDRKGPDGAYLPFNLMSKGIAKEYAEKFGKRDMQLGYTSVNGFKKPVSRYVQTHSGHCETFCKLWRLKKNSKMKWKFGADIYGTERDRNRFKRDNPKGAIVLPSEILLTQIEKDDMITKSKKLRKGVKL